MSKTEKVSKEENVIPEKCKKCFITEMAKSRGLGLFVCKGVNDKAFCELHYEKAD